ncbi:hypothetical protein FRC07_007901, partial [Ceratobasidium sp. 392]
MGEMRTNCSPPIDALPDSLLSDIFVLTCYQSSRVVCVTGRGRLECCYVLSWVSRRWRAIALSTSKIWCFLNAPHRVEYLATQLARTGEAPIDVLFDLIYLGADNILKDIEDSLDLLAEKSHWARIRDLDVELMEDLPGLSDLVIEGISKVVDASPVVNFWDICVRYTDDPINNDLEAPELDETLSALSLPYSPVLRSICLDLVSLSLKNQVSTRSLLCLQQLEFSRMIISLSNLLFPLLALAPNLTEVQISTCWFCPGPDDLTRPPSIALQKLERLSLYRVKGLPALNAVFQVCDMTSLRKIMLVSESSVSFVDEDRTIDWRSIGRCCTLEELDVGGLSSEFLADLLLQTEKLKGLRRLNIGPDHMQSPIEFVEQLVQKLVDTPCCPAL